MNFGQKLVEIIPVYKEKKIVCVIVGMERIAFKVIVVYQVFEDFSEGIANGLSVVTLRHISNNGKNSAFITNVEYHNFWLNDYSHHNLSLGKSSEISRSIPHSFHNNSS